LHQGKKYNERDQQQHDEALKKISRHGRKARQRRTFSR